MRSWTIVGAAFAALLIAGAWLPASAQQPPQGQATSRTGWVFNVAPYLWLPSVNTTLDYNLPPELGGRLPTDVSTGPGSYLTHLNFAAMVAADARNGRFSLLTDFMYTNFSATNSHIKSVDFTGLPSIPISRSLETSTGTTFKAAIWTLAGGYSVLQGDWGNLDVIAGFRLLDMNARTNFSLALTLTGPRGNGATFGGIGSASGTRDIWNGIGGVRGRILLGNTRFFIPYYFDIGAGGSQLTWQISSGLGYQFRWMALSANYRYLSFVQGGNSIVRQITMGGPMLMASFSF